ncbi:MAG: TIGR01212 family radical SAM protein [Peptococcaceae bacterium]|jgi:radical SAM protein (TIGR01212 family)|nr:TIGR01212 family radical SAM protein [Peptococcaceae bacterium]MDH7525620.1 TIGR01212 family radical SAM protein [Peptococcaceae bacterium]
MTASTALYRSYADHLRERYGEKVYKLPVNLPGTCPNRDGVLGTGGCIFCDEEGSGFDALPNTMSVKEQLEENKAFYTRRFNARRFIAYFQAFTNTYLPLESFKENIRAASEVEGLVGISVSTRPDCAGESYLEFLGEISRQKKLDITVELGLQTVNYHTLKKINRGHTLAEFIDAVLRIKKHGFAVCAHLILNLPWDDETDVVENARVLSALEIEYVKLHSLYIVKGTPLGDMYEKGEISLISLDEYAGRVVLFLENLRPQTVIQRLAGKGPRDGVLFCNWDTSWWRIKNLIEEKMKRLGTYQGKEFNYLYGKALEK